MQVTSPDPDRPTLGEVARSIGQLRDDVREGLRSLNARLDKVVSQEVYAADQRLREAQISDLRADLESKKATHGNDMGNIQARIEEIERRRREEAAKAEERRANDRRLVLSSLIFPLVLTILAAYLAARGGR